MVCVSQDLGRRREPDSRVKAMVFPHHASSRRFRLLHRRTRAAAEEGFGKLEKVSHLSCCAWVKLLMNLSSSPVSFRKIAAIDFVGVLMVLIGSVLLLVSALFLTSHMPFPDMTSGPIATYQLGRRELPMGISGNSRPTSLLRICLYLLLPLGVARR